MIIKMGTRMDNGNLINFEAEGNSTFFVRFFVDELEEDFLEMVNMFNKEKVQLVVTKEADNLYKVVSPVNYDTDEKEFRVWDIVMHKYSSLSHSVRIDEGTGTKFYPIRFSSSYIKEETPITA